MRTICLSLLAIAVMASWSTTVPAAPINGAAALASVVADSGLPVENVHCRKSKHSHKGSKPHAYGTGCK